MNSQQTITLRPAVAQDYDFTWRLYVATIREMTESLMGWDENKQSTTFAGQWLCDEVRIIQADGRDIGWLQVGVIGESVFLKQLYIDPSHQRMGVGSRVMTILIVEATQKHLPLALAVMKNNPAQRLYARLGFRIVDSDQYKFYMQRRC
jgi:ribosomal protein S18 acetylase RimI-like enzyme